MTSAPSPMTNEVPLTELSSDQLRARVARAQLYVIESAPVAGSDGALSSELEREHLAYLYKLENEGRLFGYGPVESSSDGPHRDLAYVAAPSREDAEAIAANEPLQRAGLRRNSVRAHTMNEGVACYVGRAMAKRAEQLPPFEANLNQVTFSLEELRGRAVGAAMHLIWLDPTEKPRPPEDTQTMDAHFVWLRDNEMAARLLSCGPIKSLSAVAEGAWGGGLGVLATSRQDAERLAAVEPSGTAGYRALSVQSWRLDYGLAAPIAKALQKLNQL